MSARVQISKETIVDMDNIEEAVFMGGGNNTVKVFYISGRERAFFDEEGRVLRGALLLSSVKVYVEEENNE